MKSQEYIAGLTRRVDGFLLLILLLIGCGQAFGAVPFEIICDGEATGISEDGSVIVGVATETRDAWRWTKKSGRVLLGPLPGTQTENEWGTPDVSHDGRIIAATVRSTGSSLPSLGRWSEKGGWEVLSGQSGAGIQGHTNNAWGLSNDGSVVVGQAHFPDESTRAVSWGPDGILEYLGADRINSRANDTSSDGSVIVGWSEDPASGIWQPTAWVEGKTTILTATKAFCEAMAVNAGGSIIVGQAYDESQDQRAAALWLDSDFGWVQEWLGILPGSFTGYGQAKALDLTDDGHTIVGFNQFDPTRSTGIIWTLGEGLSDIKDYLAEHGVVLPEGFRVSSVTGVSADGKYLTGFGEDTTYWPHQTRSFLIRADEFPRERPRQKILPAGTGITNPFKTTNPE